MKILGTNVGTEEFEDAACEDCIEEEEKLWNAIHWIPDLQCAWQVLVQCARPRCHHLLRTMPHSRSSTYAQAHDAGMQQAMQSLLGELPGSAQEEQVACQLASLPMRMGGLGLRSAARLAAPAFWASWADALPMFQERLPELAAQIVLDMSADPVGCLGELHEASNVGRPSWEDLQDQVSGRTVGSTSRLPLLNTISGRPLYSLNRASLTRRTFRRFVWMSFWT